MSAVYYPGRYGERGNYWWKEHYSHDEAVFQIAAAELVSSTVGLEEVTVTDEGPTNTVSSPRRLTYRIPAYLLTILAFNSARRVFPVSSEEPSGFCWLPGERIKAARRATADVASRAI